jgi:hypothetical protein
MGQTPSRSWNTFSISLLTSDIKLLDTTVGTFLGPPFGSTATKYLKRWSEEGTDSGIEEHDMLLAQHASDTPAVTTSSDTLWL